jgi:hypothetical protein
MKKYHVKLTVSERSELTAMTQKQKINAQAKLRTQILLACDEGDHGPGLTDLAIVATKLPVSKRTIEHLRA